MLDPIELFPEVPNLYEFLSVHHEMLYDKERVNKFAEAIKQFVREEDVVADIGTGTGLLAFLSLKAGAKKVHAIERTGAIDWAKKLADHHNLKDRIEFHETDSRKLDLPEKVNIIVSELIGHIAFEEGMVESLFDAKRRFLLPDGKIIPHSVQLNIVPVEEKDIYPRFIDNWEPIEGIDYQLFREEALKSCYIIEISERDFLSEPKELYSVNFNESSEEKPCLSKKCNFKICRSGFVNGITAWFDATLVPGVTLSSGPWSRTHWQQCFVPISNPFEVTAGDEISVNLNFELRKQPSDSFKFQINLQRGKIRNAKTEN